MKKSQWQVIIVVFLVLVLPVLLIILLETGKNVYKQLPIYGPKKGLSEGDTLYHSIDSYLKKVNIHPKGHIVVFNTIKAGCKDSFCEESLRNLAYIQYQMQDIEGLELITIAIKDDTNPESIKHLGKKYDIKKYNWQIVTLKRSDAKMLSEKEFLLNSKQLLNTFVLADNQLRIRGYYKSTEYQDVKKLREEIVVLSVTQDNGNTNK